MDWKQIIQIRLLANFIGSFFNECGEFIAHKYANEFFIFQNCETEEDVNCKVLEWFSRAASKGTPYKQDWRNKKFREFMLNGMNQFLHTNFSIDDVSIIYTALGNACNHAKTIEFVRSGYNIDMLKAKA